MKELIEQIAKALVDNPDQVSVRPIEGEQTTVLELRVAQTDLGKVIGKQGRTARSIRTILSAAGMKLKNGSRSRSWSSASSVSRKPPIYPSRGSRKLKDLKVKSESSNCLKRTASSSPANACGYRSSRRRSSSSASTRPLRRKVQRYRFDL